MATRPSVNSAEPIVCRPSILETSRDEPPSSLTRRREEGLPPPPPTLEPWVVDGRLPQPTLRCERDPRRVPYLAVGLDAFSPILFAVDLAHGPTRGQFRLRCPVADLPKHLGSVVRIPLEAAAEEELAEQSDSSSGTRVHSSLPTRSPYTTRI